MRVAVINYGMGNLGSVRRALAELGADVCIAESPPDLRSADRIILPGVGSFADGMANLVAQGWLDELRGECCERNKPLLGICLGMQLLASDGTEGGHSLGLDLIAGSVVRLDTLGCQHRIPHVGWNGVHGRQDSVLFKGLPEGTDFYFVHSFVFRTRNETHVSATADYGVMIAAAVERDHIFGTQFHPEKSSKAGFKVLQNFLSYRPC